MCLKVIHFVEGKMYHGICRKHVAFTSIENEQKESFSKIRNNGVSLFIKMAATAAKKRMKYNYLKLTFITYYYILSNFSGSGQVLNA